MAGRREGVETIACQLVGRNIVPEVAGLRTPDHQLTDEVPEMFPHPDDVLASMYESREFGVVGSPVDHERVRLEHRFEPLVSSASPVPDLGEVLEMAGDETFVPGQQDRLDVRKVFVQRRTPDASLSGNPRHRHRRNPMLGHQRRGGVQDRIAYRPPVRLNRLVP